MSRHHLARQIPSRRDNVFRLGARAARLALGLLCAVGPLCAGAAAVRAAEPLAAKPMPAVDVSAWAAIPVYHAGRVKPIDTYASQLMESVCHKEKGLIELGFRDYFEPKRLAQLAAQGEHSEGYQAALKMFPDGGNRKFSAPELVLSWLVEGDKWERVPFISCEHEELRKLLGAPVVGPGGMRLKFVSPHDVAWSEGLRAYLRDRVDRERAQRVAEEKFEPTPQDKRVEELLNRYSHFRAVSLDPRAPLTAAPVMLPGTRNKFMEQFNAFVEVSQTPNAKEMSVLETVRLLAESGGANPIAASAGDMLAALQEVAEFGNKLFGHREAYLRHGPEGVSRDVPLVDASVALDKLRRASAALADDLGRAKADAFAENSKLKTLRPMFRELATKSKELARLSLEMQVALYDEGESPHVAPALNPAALDRLRDVTNRSQPWLSLQALLHADELVVDFPPDELKSARDAWFSLAAAYARRSASDDERRQAVASAQRTLAAALRRLGEQIEPRRAELVATRLTKEQHDKEIIAHTKYPFQQNIDAEVKYNRTAPFFWSWIISLGAMAVFALAFGVLRRPAFWLGVAVLVLGFVWSIYGFQQRVAVTGWAPVTNMYETIIFVPAVVTLLSLWFMLLPLTWQGLRDAWRLTAAPFTFEAAPLLDSQKRRMPPSGWLVGNFVATVARLPLMVFLFVFLSVWQLSDGYRAVLPLTPSLTVGDASLWANLGAWINALTTWLVGLACLVLGLWLAPRLALAAPASLVFIPWNWLAERGAWARGAKECEERWVFGIGGAFVAAVGTWVAWYSPMFSEQFSPLQPILRSNFWLTVHVLCIVASYGAGLLALILGNIALMYYLFGKYRQPTLHASLPAGLLPAGAASAAPAKEALLPPEACATLANYAYRAVQVAVLLLAAGTILGGLWADVSWGRFWGWDPKEVWALISLLVYLAILHGRYAGWFHNFGLCAGTVAGASMIMMSWYGVNFGLPLLAGGNVGLHSYAGEGEGGLWYVVGFTAANWVFLGLAAFRYHLATSTEVTPVIEASKPSAAKLIGT